MTPALIPPHDVKPAALSTSTFVREDEAMHIQSTLHSRATIEQTSSDSGLGGDTIIFIVLGVVCLLVILIGFYLVSRPRAPPNTPPKIPTLHLPITHPRPRCERHLNTHWKTWKLWRHAARTEHPAAAAATPTSQLSFSPTTITTPPRIKRVRGSSKTYPPIVPRPPQARRVTSLSVATSFTHSHITEEALSDFRASAYDLDTDLETEMLNSARDEGWLGRSLAVVDVGHEGRDVGAGEAREARGDASPIVSGCAGGGVSPSLPTTHEEKGGGNYENWGVCENEGFVPGSAGAQGGDAMEVVIGRAL